MRSALIALILMIGSASVAVAQDLQPILQAHAAEIAKPSRGSVSDTLDAIAATGLPQITTFFEHLLTRKSCFSVENRDRMLFACTQIFVQICNICFF